MFYVFYRCSLLLHQHPNPNFYPNPTLNPTVTLALTLTEDVITGASGAGGVMDYFIVVLLYGTTEPR